MQLWETEDILVDMSQKAWDSGRRRRFNLQPFLRQSIIIRNKRGSGGILCTYLEE